MDEIQCMTIKDHHQLHKLLLAMVDTYLTTCCRFVGLCLLRRATQIERCLKIKSPQSHIGGEVVGFVNLMPRLLELSGLSELSELSELSGLSDLLGRRGC